MKIALINKPEKKKKPYPVYFRYPVYSLIYFNH